MKSIRILRARFALARMQFNIWRQEKHGAIQLADWEKKIFLEGRYKRIRDK